MFVEGVSGRFGVFYLVVFAVRWGGVWGVFLGSSDVFLFVFFVRGVLIYSIWFGFEDRFASSFF